MQNKARGVKYTGSKGAAQGYTDFLKNRGGGGSTPGGSSGGGGNVITTPEKGASEDEKKEAIRRRMERMRKRSKLGAKKVKAF